MGRWSSDHDGEVVEVERSGKVDSLGCWARAPPREAKQAPVKAKPEPKTKPERPERRRTWSWGRSRDASAPAHADAPAVAAGADEFGDLTGRLFDLSLDSLEPPLDLSAFDDADAVAELTVSSEDGDVAGKTGKGSKGKGGRVGDPSGSDKAATADKDKDKEAERPSKSVHRRVWSFGRAKVAPAAPATLERDSGHPVPSPPPSVLLDTSQSDGFSLALDELLRRPSVDGSVRSEGKGPEGRPSPTSVASAAAASISGSAPSPRISPAPGTAAKAVAPAAAPGGYRRLWQSITSVRRGETPPDLPPGPPEVTVEGLVRAVQRLKPGRPVIEAVSAGLPFLDSRAVAALLKELAKGGLPHHAAELFDYLRGLPEDDPLSRLADLYTYTTIVSQCGSHQQLRRALELVAEMRGRGITLNIHTYSALMSVCVKCGECELALDVYQQLLAEGCTPNLVTSNILIDVYGKTGAWERAVEVLDNLAAQGTTPEPRTFNSIIAACAKAGQPAAALGVYRRMLSVGVAPTSTTCTSLISAFGKTGQVEEALAIFEDMAARGCERNVITYSSLISACERAGRCDIALRVFVDMQREGCRPNVVTYNALIGACGQAGAWGKAAELFEGMVAAGCRPDAVTYSVLVAAFERGGQWQRALQAFERMQQQHRPDACVLNVVLEALWRSGLVSAQAKAFQLVSAAFRAGHLRLASPAPGECTATAHTYAASLAVLLRWLAELRDGPLSGGGSGDVSVGLGGRVSLLLTRGKHCRSAGSYDQIAAHLGALFVAVSAPLSVEIALSGALSISGDATSLGPWLASSPGAVALLSPMAAAAGAPVHSAALLHEDAAAQRQCGPAFAAVLEYEASHPPLTPDALSSPRLAGLRQDLAAAVVGLGQALSLSDEITCEGVALCDRLLARSGEAAATAALEPSAAPLLAAGALLAAARGAGLPGAVLQGQGEALMQLAGLGLPTVIEAEQRVGLALNGDVSAISPLRCLHLLLERLGISHVSLRKCELMQLMALSAAELATKASLSPAMATFPPSLVAAACLAKARASIGLHPAWPSSLQAMTGYSPEQQSFASACDLLSLLGLAV